MRPDCEYLLNIGQDLYVSLKYIVEHHDDLPSILVSPATIIIIE